MRMICEQVSHHPPVGAVYAESLDNKIWTYEAAIEVKNKFWGKSLEVFPTGINHVRFPARGEHYTYQKAVSCVHNILLGNLWLDNYGDIEIVEQRSGLRCQVKMHKTGWMTDAKNFAAVHCQVFTPSGAPVPAKLSGFWNQYLDLELPHCAPRRLWTVAKRPPSAASNHFNLTAWGIALNELPPGESASSSWSARRHAPTDSRYRPDQRALELGDVGRGGEEKTRLEVKQRERRRGREAAGERWRARWFERTGPPPGEEGEEDWRYKGGYFERQATPGERWKDNPDIF